MRHRIKEWIFIVTCFLIFLIYAHHYISRSIQSPRHNTTPNHQLSSEWSRPKYRSSNQPTSDYQKQMIQGFELFIEKPLLRPNQSKKRLLKRFNQILQAIAQATPGDQLSILRKTKIWLSVTPLRSVRHDGTFDISGEGKNLQVSEAAGWYEVSDAETLRKYNLNPDKAKGIEVGEILTFLRYSYTYQQALVLHELAHAYHDRVLGQNNFAIQAAYQQAISKRLYNVPDYLNRQKQAYAATDTWEYFAELSTAYLLKNDAFPYNRATLSQHDTVGYQLMQQTWEP
jgi:hypothetical protein